MNSKSNKFMTQNNNNLIVLKMKIRYKSISNKLNIKTNNFKTLKMNIIRKSSYINKKLKIYLNKLFNWIKKLILIVVKVYLNNLKVRK